MPHHLIKRLFLEPESSYFLFGPRGTGKSTLMAERHREALYINLLLARIRREFLARPEMLLEMVRAQPNGKVIVIDEIQKVPELLSLVHVLIEEHKDWKFILTGSSSRKLKREGVDLLGGRALNKTLHPFMAIELAEQFNFKEALLYGLLPLRFASKNPYETLSAYISLYLDEEVKAEGLVRQIEPFARFLEALSFSHGSILNMNKVSQEAAVKRSTAESWLSIVQDLLIVFQVPVFTRRAKRLLSSQPKFYFFDVGVFRSLRPQSVLDQPSEMDGAALEGLIAQHLRAWVDYTSSKHELFFWRTKSGVEVDFVVYGPLGLWAIEVKNSQQIRPEDLRGLKHFKEDYPEAQTIVVYRGEQALKKGDILCLPAENFLRALSPNKPF